MSTKITEANSIYNHLEKMSTRELLENMNREDQGVAVAVSKSLSQVEKLADAVFEKMSRGGRLFYIGAGTSGRLGIVDASECPPTYGIEQGRVIGIIAGGDGAIRKAVEFAEDDPDAAWKDLQQYNISGNDIVVGIAASGSTPYVAGGLRACKSNDITTGCVTCNNNTPVAAVSDFPVEVITGPEFVTGSTRMKAGTAQKLVLNMITTTVMVKLGRVRGNKMVDMQLTNNKLVDRGTKMIMDALHIEEKEAKELLDKHGSVRNAVDHYHRKSKE